MARSQAHDPIRRSGAQAQPGGLEPFSTCSRSLSRSIPGARSLSVSGTPSARHASTSASSYALYTPRRRDIGVPEPSERSSARSRRASRAIRSIVSDPGRSGAAQPAFDPACQAYELAVEHPADHDAEHQRREHDAPDPAEEAIGLPHGPDA